MPALSYLMLVNVWGKVKRMMHEIKEDSDKTVSPGIVNTDTLE